MIQPLILPCFHGVESVLSERLNHVPDVDVNEASPVLQCSQFGRCPIGAKSNLVAPLFVILSADRLVLKLLERN